MKILKYKKVFLSIAMINIVISMSLILFFGFNLGIDFKGGSIYEIKYEQKNIPSLIKIKQAILNSNIKIFNVQKLGQKKVVIKIPELSDKTKKKLDEELTMNKKYTFNPVQLKTISPSISSEFVNKSIWAIILVSIIIVLFIAYVFKGVSRPVSSYKYGLIAIIALLHDVIIPTGIFALLGYFFVEYQINILFVTAILAILGYSVNDTIVVFDRIRENLKLKNDKKEKKTGKKFEKLVGKSLNQTINRSIFTSLTTLIVISFLYFIGGENTKPFALVLGIGIIAGTYSSIFVASLLLIYTEKKWKSKGNKKYKSEMTKEELIEELTKI